MRLVGLRRASPVLLAVVAVVVLGVVGRLLTSTLTLGAGCARAVGGAVDAALLDVTSCTTGAALPQAGSAFVVALALAVPLLLAHLVARDASDRVLVRLRGHAACVAAGALALVEAALRPVAAPTAPLRRRPRRVVVPLLLDVAGRPALRRGPPVLAV